MNKKRASENLLESFVRLVNKYNALSKHPMTYGTLHKFYHSERHMLDIVGDDPGLNLTEFAKAEQQRSADRNVFFVLQTADDYLRIGVQETEAMNQVAPQAWVGTVP